MLARRATPMYLVSDLDEARLNYEALGFEPKPTNDDGCLGVIAGSTSVILLDREYAERTLPARAIALLEEKPALYIWVESLDAMRAELQATFLGEANMAGLREWAVEGPLGLVVLAETSRAH
jgi:predicted lactoylglutathione lyase